MYDIYSSFPIGVMKADFFRYAVLLAHGGVYADVDTACQVGWEAGLTKLMMMNESCRQGTCGCPIQTMVVMFILLVELIEFIVIIIVIMVIVVIVAVVNCRFPSANGSPLRTTASLTGFLSNSTTSRWAGLTAPCWCEVGV